MAENIRVAVHSILLPDGEEVTPGKVFDVPAGDLKYFEDVGAVREPSEAELALYEVSKPKAEAKPAPKSDKADAAPTGGDLNVG